MDDATQVKSELLMAAVRKQTEDAVRKIMEALNAARRYVLTSHLLMTQVGRGKVGFSMWMPIAQQVNRAERW